MRMRPGLAPFWSYVGKMRPVTFLSLSFEPENTASFHSGHWTSRAFAELSKFAAAVCWLYKVAMKRYRFTNPCLLRCRCTPVSTLNVLLFLDTSKPMKNVHASCRRSCTFWRSTAHAFCTGWKVFKPLQLPILDSAQRFVVARVTQATGQRRHSHWGSQFRVITSSDSWWHYDSQQALGRLQLP